MSGEFDPYTPPQAAPPARGMDVADGRLWKIEGGRLFVRDRASLPDVCVLGTIGEEGARTSETISAGNRWMSLLSIAPLAMFFWFFVGSSPPRGLFIATLVIVVMLPLVMGKMAKSVQVMIFRSRRRVWLQWTTRTGIWAAMIVCAMRIGDPFVEAGLLSERAGHLLAVAVFVGARFIIHLLRLHAFTGAVAAEDGWFELKGFELLLSSGWRTFKSVPFGHLDRWAPSHAQANSRLRQRIDPPHARKAAEVAVSRVDHGLEF